MIRLFSFIQNVCRLTTAGSFGSKPIEQLALGLQFLPVGPGARVEPKQNKVQI